MVGLWARIRLLFQSKANAALDRAEDPRELVEYAYGQQQELLRKTKRGLIEVATSKVRLERQAQKLRAQVPHIDDQARRALGIGREDLARVALERKQSVVAEAEQLDQQVTEVALDEQRLTRTEQELAAKIEQFRVRRDSIGARYSAAQAQVRVTEALSGVSGEFADLGMALGRAVEKTDRMQARASAMGSLMEAGSLALPEHATDPVESELYQVRIEQTVDDELDDLKAEMGLEGQPPALGGGKQERENGSKTGEK